MEELLTICQTMLDNADLDITIELYTSTIILDFVVGGSLENIIIRCKNYSHLEVLKDPDEEQSFFIGETHIELINSEAKIRQLYKEDTRFIYIIDHNTTIIPLFHLRCDGSITLDIICSGLEWKIDDNEFQTIVG